MSEKNKSIWAFGVRSHFSKLIPVFSERSATQQLSPNAVNRQQEIQSVVKEVDSIVTTVNTAANKVSSSNTSKLQLKIVC